MDNILNNNKMQLKLIVHHVELYTNQQTTAGKAVEKRNTSALWVGMQTGAATVENSM